jgi:hypothetical protein
MFMQDYWLLSLFINWSLYWNAAVLSASVYLASALHSSDFGPARYGLVYATGRQGTRSQIKYYVLRGGVRSIVTRAHRSYCVYNGEIFCTTLLSRAYAERVILISLPHWSPSVRRQDK